MAEILAEYRDAPARAPTSAGNGYPADPEELERFLGLTGELRAADREPVLALLHTVLVGLTDAVSDDLAEQRAAIDAICALLDGTLIQTVADPHPA